MVPTQWERTVRKGSGREESPLVQQCGADWKISLSVGKGKERGQDEMMQKIEFFTEGPPWAQTLFRSSGRKTRRAWASCSTYFLVHTFWWIALKPTSKVSLSHTQGSWQIYRTMVRHQWKVSFSSSRRHLQTHCAVSCVLLTAAPRDNKNTFLGFQGAFITEGNNNYIIVFFSFINVLKNQIPSIWVLLELRLHMQQNPLRDEICAFHWMTILAFSLRALLKVQDGSLLEQIWAFFLCFF